MRYMLIRDPNSKFSYVVVDTQTNQDSTDGVYFSLDGVCGVRAIAAFIHQIDAAKYSSWLESGAAA